MRVLFATIGSLGDLHPYLAVAVGLRARGHEVAIATNSVHRERVEAARVEWRPMRPEAPDTPSPELFARAMDRRYGPEFVFRDLIVPAARDQVADLLVAAAGADLLVSTPLSLGLPIVAERLGVPWAAAALQPMLMFSVTDPPIPPQAAWLAPLHRFGALVGRPLRALARSVTRDWGEPVRALQREFGVADRADPLGADQFSPLLNLAMFSSTFARPQPDWPKRTSQTGFAFLDTVDGLPDEVERFLAAGPPPVVFTLGSAAVHTSGRFYGESLAAAYALGRRALLLTGPDVRELPQARPNEVLAVPYASHAAVFPRACAVVHQGGIGTAAEALRAGRPALVAPFSHDQPDNAARLQRLGAAEVLPIGRYTARRATAALGRVLTDTGMAARAAELGEHVRAEDGVRAACDAIETVLRMPSRVQAPR